jgi:hypothetical protein
MVSWVWKHFEKFGEIAKCKHCLKNVKCRGGSTSGLVRHLKFIHHLYEKHDSNFEYLLKTKQIGESSKTEKVEKLIIEMIAQKYLPLNIVECEPFIDLIKLLDPVFKLPTVKILKLKLNECIPNIESE